MPAVVPQGRRRVICSGDSFALGYGVDDRDTWCRRLTAHPAVIQALDASDSG